MEQNYYTPSGNSSETYKPPIKPVSVRTGNQGPRKLNLKPIIFMVAIFLIIVFVGWKIFKAMEARKMGNPIEIINNPNEVPIEYPVANKENVSPISGLACDNWQRRPIAVMQPADASARPLAGISQADMVIEMPVLPDGKPRLMSVYVCESPTEIGSIRSARHDFLHLAKGLDAILIHWGGSQFAKEKLDQGLLNDMNCNDDGGASASRYCFRKEGFASREDTGYIKFSEILKGVNDFGYGLENRFSGYAHTEELPVDERIEGGSLKVGLDFASGDYYVEYRYDKEINSYLRFWAKKEDTDRNNGKRIAPKNVVVLIASQEMMLDDNKSVYNNVQFGDPWYDESDSGEAFYYINGQEVRGKWKKDKARIDSKLLFLDQNGNEIKFVPGQIWVEVLEPGRMLKWTVDEMTNPAEEV